MAITKQMVARKIASYLHHETNLAELVDWAERAFMDADFDPADTEVLADVVARLGAADVRAFGLTGDDCEAMLATLGFTARVEIVAA
jgi:hypothetical protein